MERDHPAELDLVGYLRVVRRRWWIVVLVPLVGGTAAFLQARSQTNIYRSQTAVLISRTQAEQLFDPLRGNPGDPDRLLANQIRIVESQDVRQRAAKRLGARAPIDASAAKNQDVLTLTAHATTAKRAADIANAYANAYVEYRVDSSKNENAVAQAEVQRQINALQAQLGTLDSGSRAGTPVDASRSSLIEQLNGLRTQMGRLAAAAEVATGGVQILQPAAVPTSPFEPRPMVALALGIGVGLMLGLSLAFLVDYLDDTIKEKDDIDRIAPDLATLALIPRVQGWRNRREAILISDTKPNTPVAESYRTLRTSIQFLSIDRPIKTLQITSSVAGEGKSTTLANLSVALARAGTKVIVVCCDLRHPRIHEFFELSNGVGFTSVLLGDVPLSNAIQKVPGQPLIRVLASGPPPPNPSELLSSPRTSEMLNALQAQCDIVLIDSPPILPVTDPAVLSSKVDATLLVTTARSTTRRDLRHSLDTLKQVGAPLIGCVLNRVRSSEQYGYRYYYSYQEPDLELPDDHPSAIAGR